MTTLTAAPQDLVTLGADIFFAVGVPTADARLLADSLVTAELWGHSSHGMLRLPWYVARLRSGAMEPVTQPTVVTDTGPLVVLDGHHGIGQVLTGEAVDLGVERARAHGIAGVAVRNSNHFGTAAYFTRRAAEAGCVALLATNASPAMGPWGGREKAVGTNPWSIAAPAGSYGPVVTASCRTHGLFARRRREHDPPGHPRPGATVFLNGQTLFQGGAGIPLHVHNCPESVVILEGSAIVEIDGQEYALTTFDTTYVDANVPHRFRNASDTEPMRILWTYASVDATRTVVETGVTTRVDAEHDRPRTPSS